MNTHIAVGILKYTKWGEVKASFTRMINSMRSPIHIVVYGESGVGKTQFLNTIMSNGIISDARTRDINRKRFRLPNGRNIIFCDTPGHKSLKNVRDTLKPYFHKKKIQGIINIVDYGYSSVPDMDSTSVFNVDTREVKDKYLEDNRLRQLEQLSEWQDLVNSQNGVKWFLTLVNKADIWYEKKEAVMNYYLCGEYAQALNGMERCCKVVAFPFCSIISPFCGKPMMLIMSEKDKIAMHQDLFVEIQKLSFEKE